MEDLSNIIESLLFVAENPLSLDQLQAAIPEASADDIQQALFALKAAYGDRNGGFVIHEVAGGYQFRTRPEYKEWVRRLLQPKPPKLSKPAMETLAIIAYRQPILRSEIEHIRGVESANSLRILLERKLIRVLGRREIPGRPLVYATTTKFLETFDLRDLKDLPTLKEIADLENASGRPRQQELIFAKDEEQEADADSISGGDGEVDGENDSQRNDYDDSSI
jgi:segregation and condensation protein B